MLRKEQVYQTLKQRITNLYYLPGSKLPAEQHLAAELKVSRVTLRAALAELQRENLIEKNGRSGNYVSGSINSKRFIYLTFSPNFENLGIVNSYRVSELQNVFSKYNHSLILYSALNLLEHTSQSFSKLLKDNSISGIFLSSLDFNYYPALLDLAISCNIPVVDFGNRLWKSGCPCIEPVLTGVRISLWNSHFISCHVHSPMALCIGKEPQGRIFRDRLRIGQQPFRKPWRFQDGTRSFDCDIRHCLHS